MKSERVKQCTKCKGWKDVTKFQKRCIRKDGFSNRCKECLNELQKICRQRPEVKKQRKEYGEEYRRRPHVKALIKKNYKKYYQRPEVKKRIKKYAEEYRRRPDVIAHRRILHIKYYKNPEVRARIKECGKKRSQRPDVKAYNNAYSREYTSKAPDAYIAGLLKVAGFTPDTITPEMIEVKRNFLLWYREINQNKEVLKNGINPE